MFRTECVRSSSKRYLRSLYIYKIRYRKRTEHTFFVCHTKKVSKKNHRFLNLSRKLQSIFPLDSGNSSREKRDSNSPESTHLYFAKNTLIFFVKFKRRIKSPRMFSNSSMYTLEI